MTSGAPAARISAASRLLLALAAASVCFAAADTYVVVLALPDMMASTGIGIDELQRAAPIVSGFLLGYVAILPLIGRIADLRGRLPVLVASLVLFAIGSLVTAVAYDMTSMVAGRFVQGVGGGGLVPATLALVADLYPPKKRGIPLGIVSAVQEIGSVLGPLLGAVVLAVSDWRAIFALNLAVGLVLAAGVSALRRAGDGVTGSPEEAPRGAAAFDWWGAALSLALTVAVGLVMIRPGALMADITWGQLYVGFFGPSRWITPLGVVCVALLLGWVARMLVARRPLVDVRSWGRSAAQADLLGSLWLALGLGGVILAFATADPQVQVFSDRGLAYLAGSALASTAFVVHLRRAKRPLVPRGAFAALPAWGALVVSFFVGAALIAALIDIPLFARTTVHPDSQLDAALVLVRFLAALPVGAVLGGWAIRWLAPGAVAAIGMAMAGVSFVLMSQWGLTSLESSSSTLTLVLGGLGFGLALAPVNAALLDHTDDDIHGVASAFVVVARMVGMLVGISVLTTLGLRRYYAEQADVPSLAEVCDGASRCAEYTTMLRLAGIAQEQAVFAGAAVACLIAAVAALATLRRPATV